MTRPVLTLACRALLRVSGADWRPFLQGLITQDVETLTDHGCAYGALLTPQGRLLHDFFLWSGGEDCLIDVASSGAEDLARRLSLYRLRARVEIAPAPGSIAVAPWDGDTPSAAASDLRPWRPDPRRPELGWRTILAAKADADPGAERAYRLFCLEQGVGALEIDGRESDYPLELNLDLFGGVDFKKGCFVGQETTSRMHRRGVVKNRLLPVTFEGAPPPLGAEILSEDLRAGEMRGSVEGRGVALLRLDRSTGALRAADAGGAGEQRLRLDPRPWMDRFGWGGEL